jgi:predicted amidophosphoribosyltransferase
MNDCNVCYDSNGFKCTSCTFMICKSCINKLSNSLETQCPACKKKNTFTKTKHIIFNNAEDFERYDKLFNYIDYFTHKYGPNGSIQLR